MSTTLFLIFWICLTSVPQCLMFCKYYANTLYRADQNTAPQNYTCEMIQRDHFYIKKKS